MLKAYTQTWSMDVSRARDGGHGKASGGSAGTAPSPVCIATRCPPLLVSSARHGRHDLNPGPPVASDADRVHFGDRTEFTPWNDQGTSTIRSFVPADLVHTCSTSASG